MRVFSWHCAMVGGVVLVACTATQRTFSGGSGADGLGGGDLGGFGGGSSAACEMACETSHAADYAKFVGYEFTECGCASGAPCQSACSSSCPTGPASASCSACLQTESNKDAMCIDAAGGDCLDDMTCSDYINCSFDC